jgi:uncharacterized protein (DUF4415 family)
VRPGRKPGRPRLDPDGRVKFTTRLFADDIDALREIGRGAANDGIEQLLRAFRKTLNKHVKRASRQTAMLPAQQGD